MVRPWVVVRTLTLCGLAVATLASAETNKSKTIVTYPSAFAVSQPAADLPVESPYFPGREMPEPRPRPNHGGTSGPLPLEDPALQKEVLPEVAATLGASFEGVAALGWVPSDSNIAVSSNYVVETVNAEFAVYNKSGGTLAGPTNISSLFAGLSGDCSSGVAYDPIVLYDRAADRWVISMIGHGSTYSECIAVAQTNNPTGAYYLYGYSFGANLNDYPKLGTWATASNPAYLATFDIFSGSTFIGVDICGFDRAKLQAGNNSAALLCQITPSSEFSYLPSDMDGPTPPVNGTPGLFISHHSGSPGTLYLRKLTLNFATATATLSSPTSISVANYTDACHSSCVPQSGTTQLLDALGDLTMYRFGIRHFTDHDRATLNYSVVNGSSVAVRWYELYDPAGTVTVNQQGTFAPDSTYRWMGSIAEDQDADIGLGYSASSSSLYPAILFTGRLFTDALGTMESEASILAGSGSQLPDTCTTGPCGNRWGDYTAMQVDPSDDCTFWYVDQYEPANGDFNWHTRIASFKFPTCSSSPDFLFSFLGGSSEIIIPGNGAAFTFQVLPLRGFTGSVTLSVGGLPSGSTYKFSVNPITGGSGTSQINITIPGTTPLGNYPLTFTGTSGSLVHSLAGTLVVQAVSCTPNYSCTNGGDHATANISLTCNGASNISVAALACMYDGFGGQCGQSSNQGNDSSISTGVTKYGGSDTFEGCGFKWSWGGNNYSEGISF
jgi:hypothetical protein